jgi:chemotaxis protein CheC
VTPALLPEGLESLRQLAAEGGAESARAVGRLVGIESSLESVEAMGSPDADALAALTEGLGTDLVAVGMELVGPLRGRLLLFVGAADAERIASRLVPSAPAGSLDALGESALVEAGNIAGSTFVSALARRLRAPLLHGVPRLTRGAARACLEELAGTPTGPVLAPRFRCAGQPAILLFLPDPERVAALVAAMEAG